VFVEDADWVRLIDQLGRGECTPFLGAGACEGVLPNGGDMSREWAAAYEYPFTDNLDLARVMQYAVMQVGDPVDLKRSVCDFLMSRMPPHFEDPCEPHALLAVFPIPVFLTTNYDDFLIKALQWAGKRPNSAMCSWSPGANYDSALFASRAGLKPDKDEPLVYHLHGSAHVPRSLVLTENDYLEFLVRITGSHHSADSNIIPSAILSALTDNPLLFIGYSLQDWTFRVIFHGLLSTIPDTHRRRSVSVQLLPPTNDGLEETKAKAERYMNRYLGNWNISIFWGTAAEFCRQLRERAGTRL
jgi:SIR2-like domain